MSHDWRACAVASFEGGARGGGGGVQIHWLVPSYICIYSKAHRDKHKHKLCIVV